MATLVVPFVTRFALTGGWTNGQQIVNTIDIAWDTEGAFGSREDNIQAVAEDVRNAWQDHIVEPMSNNYTFFGCTYVDINSLTGVTGGVGPDPARPTVGTNPNPALPPNMCMQVEKITSSQRGNRAGRWYLSGHAEGDLNEDGHWNTTYRENWNAALADFLESVTDIGGLELDKAPVVIHAKTSTGDKITQMVAKSLVSRQDRRIGR